MKRIIVILLCLLSLSATAQNKKRTHRSSTRPVAAPAAVERKQQMTIWVDSVMATLTLDQKISQLLMVRVPAQTAKPKVLKAFESELKEYQPGGICFFGGTTTQQLQRTVRYQNMAKVPMLVSIDGEWGLGMRLTDAYSFPRQMMMGALSPKNDSLIFLMGAEIAKQCKMMGINVDFAPVADLNSNPNNPVIGTRSFGEDKKRVAAKAILYTKALQNGGVMAVGKHFPGHGDTDVDSHSGLPEITHTIAYIDSVDLYPFRQLARSGCRGMMVAHLQVNALDNTPKTPSSTSEKIVNQILRKRLGFNGLIFTDGMDMGAITKNFKKGEGELKALMAGADVILLPSDIPETVKKIKEQAVSDSMFARLIDYKCRNVLREKYRLGLHKQNLNELTVPTKTDYTRCEKLTEQIASKALTLIRNTNNVLPLQENDKVVFLALGDCDTAITTLNDATISRISEANKIVLNLNAFQTPGRLKNYGVTPQSQDLIKQIVAFNPNTILVIYGSPYSLKFFQEDKKKGSFSQLPAAIVMAYQNLPEVHRIVPDALYGKTSFEGILPVSVDRYNVGASEKANKAKKVDPYAMVKRMDMKAECFKKIDSIALIGIDKKAYPGCQILIAYKGQIVYNRGYGRLTYDEKAPRVDTNTIYDLASLTKVTATTFAVMKLVDEGKIKIDDPLSRYLPYLKHSNKKNITIKECLSHIAKLKAFDAYYKQVDNVCGNQSINFSISTDQCEKCKKEIIDQIVKSKLNKETKYVYSDLGFILLAELVENVSGTRLDHFMTELFYKPMGMNNTTFLPRKSLDTNRIAPTENDTYFRHRLLRGEVQDQNASALGGVAGHAGLFSTATDINKLYQMMLNGGTYKGKRYLSKEVIDMFNKRYYENNGNRRALGYDKPFIHSKSTHIAPEASQSSYGHTGYTGTMVWIDPDYQLVYIFLSNRVYPDATTNKLAQLNIRTDIQSLIYQSINKK